MSNTHIAFLNRSNVPDRKTLQASIDRLAFNLKLDPEFKPFEDSRFPPCVFDGTTDVGFEIYYAPTSGIADGDPNLTAIAADRDFSISMVWRGSMKDCACAMIVSCALAIRVLLMGVLIALTTQTALAVEKDCAEPACPAITITGDKEATLPNGEPSPFHGFADASMRRDPESGRLWMAYSWPSVRIDQDGRRGLFRRQGGVSPQVEIHLAYSDDRGRTWQLAKVLWPATPSRSPTGEEGHMSHEVANLLPVRENGGVVWYGARLDYFLPDDGGFRKRPPQSFRILIGRAASPGDLAVAPMVALGSMATDPAWGVDVDLARLSPETRHCMLWNEPALFHDGEELFLALSCMAFRGKTPDMERNDLVVFATRPQGPPSRWQWRYAGKLAGAREASELGGERLTQIDLAGSRDGRLLAILTPDIWNAEAGDFVHLGCVAVEVESADRSLRLARDAAGRLKVAAKVTASDAGPSGTAACTYDPASETGIILDKRIKIGAGLGHARDRTRARMSVELHATGLYP